jgi:3-dehydro-L-gulonate 2-dehydrogenase
MPRLPFTEIVSELSRVLAALGFAEDRARACATLVAETHRDGVATHGLNRFPRLVRQIKAGRVKPDALPVAVARCGPWEQWDGQLGPGNLNATAATDRAITLARDHGLGLVALRNTNHWMRGGSYGWQAARAGMAFIGWTNTIPNMPAWGGLDSKLGNNPLIVALPRGDAPVVLDVAMSQFSYGKLERLQLRGESLPFPGGYDANGSLTTDPAAILATQRSLPIGYWKGAGMALVLDLLAALLSGGLTTREIGLQGGDEYGMSQVFVAIDVARPAGAAAAEALVTTVIDDVHASRAINPAHPVRYPGEGVLRTREENDRLGIPVDGPIWSQIKALP